MVLKPQDALVLLKLVAVGRAGWSYNTLAVALGMSPSEVHAAIKRTLVAGLAIRDTRGIRPHFRNLEEFLVHGLKYVFAPDRGELTRGMATAHAAPALEGKFLASDEPPPVWPDPEGDVRGAAFSPLYKCAPKAAREDPALYELLTLVDAIRGGRAREREMAVKALKECLNRHAKRLQPKP
jgi:hypothetical protein